MIRLAAAGAPQGAQGAAHLVVELVYAAAGGEHQPVDDALHAAGHTAVVHGRGQQDAVSFNAGGDDVVDAVIIPHAAEAAGVQTVVAGHAGVDVGTGLEYLELHAGGFHLLADGVQQEGGVAVFPGAAVDGDDLHKGDLLICNGIIIQENGEIDNMTLPSDFLSKAVAGFSFVISPASLIVGGAAVWYDGPDKSEFGGRADI